MTTQNKKRLIRALEAWEMGHSSGFSEVEHYFNDLSVLIE